MISKQMLLVKSKLNPDIKLIFISVLTNLKGSLVGYDTKNICFYFVVFNLFNVWLYLELIANHTCIVYKKGALAECIQIQELKYI